MCLDGRWETNWCACVFSGVGVVVYNVGLLVVCLLGDYVYGRILHLQFCLLKCM